MEPINIPVNLGVLTEEQIARLQAVKDGPVCMFRAKDEQCFEEQQKPKRVTLKIVQDYVLEVGSETGQILSGFKCDLKHNYEIIRSIRPIPDVTVQNIKNLEESPLKFPIAIKLYLRLQTQEKEIGLKIDQDYHHAFEVFLSVLETQYIPCRNIKERYSGSREIGSGSFAKVYRAKDLCDHKRYVAIKAFNKQTYFVKQPKGRQSFEKQLKILTQVNHKNINKFLGVYESDNSIYVVLEDLQISLFHYLYQFGFPPLAGVKKIMREMLDGVAYLHSKGIMHRDLKFQNIMLRIGGGIQQIVIIDFGLGQYVDSDEFLFTRCGSPGYVAPQVLATKEKAKYSEICDVFSVGAMMYFMLFKRPAIEGSQLKQLVQKNIECNIDFNFNGFNTLSKNGQQIVKRMLQKDPNKRISAKDALEHPFFFENQDKNQEKTIIMAEEQVQESQQKN